MVVLSNVSVDMIATISQAATTGDACFSTPRVLRFTSWTSSGWSHLSDDGRSEQWKPHPIVHAFDQVRLELFRVVEEFALTGEPPIRNNISDVAMACWYAGIGKNWWSVFDNISDMNMHLEVVLQLRIAESLIFNHRGIAGIFEDRTATSLAYLSDDLQICSDTCALIKYSEWRSCGDYWADWRHLV